MKNQADAELIKLEREYRKQAEKAMFATVEKNDAMAEAREELPDDTIICIYCLIDEYGLNPTREDAEKFLSRMSVDPEGRDDALKHFEENKKACLEILKKYGYLKALNKESAATIRRCNAFEKIRETPAQTNAGLQTKINVLYLECDRQEYNNTCLFAALQVRIAAVGSARKAA